MTRPKPPGHTDHHTVEETATILNCSIRKVWYLIDAGTLPVVRLKGPRTLITPTGLGDYIEQRTHTQEDTP